MNDLPDDAAKVLAGFGLPTGRQADLLKRDPNRKPDGKFGHGNKANDVSKTAPVRRKRIEFQLAVLSSVDTDDIQDIMHALIREAKSGNITAAREVLDRTVGKADESELIARLGELESIITKKTKPPEIKESDVHPTADSTT
jgi:hypothetical protein